MREENYPIARLIEIVMVLILIFFCMIAMVIVITTNIVSAWPYQLNISSGVLIDLNASNNETMNFTIYIIPQNVTYINQTNITYVNITYVNFTCINCTMNNYTNYTYIYNGTVNQTDFLTIVDFNSYKAGMNYPTMAQFNNLLTKVDFINNTSTGVLETSHTGIWIGIIIAILLGIIGIFLAFKAGMET